jgi:hypothetical protein
VGPEAIAAWSRGALDRTLAGDGELLVATPDREALVLGAFQRGAGMPSERPLVRRGSGGPELVAGTGSVWVALALTREDTLVLCDAARIVNRYVRPLARALTSVGATAHFFGRDWISVMHRPAAWIGFAHDATTRRTLVEAVVAVRTPFAREERASFLGKPQGTLESITGRTFDLARLADAIVAAYTRDHDVLDLTSPLAPVSAADGDLRADPPWPATTEEAIGTIGAGRDAHGVLRVGGDLLVSRDALAHLEARLAALPTDAPDEDIARAIDATLAAPGVALDGVRSLTSVLDVARRARALERVP